MEALVKERVVSVKLIFTKPVRSCLLHDGFFLHFFLLIIYNTYMPSVFNEKGYRFFFFSNEGNPQEPCHIHVRKHGALAKIWIDSKCSLADNIGFTAKELREIEDIANHHITEIKGAWNGFFFK